MKSPNSLIPKALDSSVKNATILFVRLLCLVATHRPRQCQWIRCLTDVFLVVPYLTLSRAFVVSNVSFLDFLAVLVFNPTEITTINVDIKHTTTAWLLGFRFHNKLCREGLIFEISKIDTTREKTEQTLPADDQLWGSTFDGKQQHVAIINIENEDQGKVDSNEGTESTKGEDETEDGVDSAIREIERKLGIRSDVIDIEAQTDSPRVPNIYQNKKTFTQGMMDLALFSANASQLRYVIESGRKEHSFFYLSLVLICISLFFQVVVGVSLIMLVVRRQKEQNENDNSETINDFANVGIFLIVVVNVFITAFGIPANTPPEL